MSDISSVMIAMLLEELMQYGSEHGFRVFATQELDPVDPENAFMITVMTKDSQCNAKFMGRTMISALRGATDWVKHLVFSDPAPSHQSQPPQE